MPSAHIMSNYHEINGQCSDGGLMSQRCWRATTTVNVSYLLGVSNTCSNTASQHPLAHAYTSGFRGCFQ